MKKTCITLRMLSVPSLNLFALKSIYRPVGANGLALSLSPISLQCNAGYLSSKEYSLRQQELAAGFLSFGQSQDDPIVGKVSKRRRRVILEHMF